MITNWLFVMLILWVMCIQTYTQSFLHVGMHKDVFSIAIKPKKYIHHTFIKSNSCIVSHRS